MRRSELLPIMIAGSALLFAAGCGSSSSRSSSATTKSTASTSAASGGLKTDSTPKYAAPASSAPVQSGTVQVAYRNIAIDPDTIKVKVGSTIKWTDYDNVTHKGSWAPVVVSNQLGVAMVNVQEIGTGCAKITNAITIKYTAAHPNLGAVTITMDGPGGPYTTSLTDDGGATPQDRFGTASVNLPMGTTIADLNKCAYLVKMSVVILLTTGDAHPLPIDDEVAFCK